MFSDPIEVLSDADRHCRSNSSANLEARLFAEETVGQLLADVLPSRSATASQGKPESPSLETVHPVPRSVVAACRSRSPSTYAQARSVTRASGSLLDHGLMRRYVSTKG